MRRQETVDPNVHRILIEGIRRMSVAERLARVAALNEFAKNLQLADIRRRHPNADEREIRLRLASRWLGPELTRRVHGWDVDVEGY